MNFLLWFVLVLCAILYSRAEAQTVTNNGGIFYLAPRAVVHVNGSYQSINSGRLIAEDSARITLVGSMFIRSGRVTLNQRSIAVVDSNIVTSGVPCTVAYGFLERSGSGTLTIKGSLFNEGQVQNSATIYVWRDFLNRGSLSNSGLLEVGQP